MAGGLPRYPDTIGAELLVAAQAVSASITHIPCSVLDDEGSYHSRRTPHPLDRPTLQRAVLGELLGGVWCGCADDLSWVDDAADKNMLALLVALGRVDVEAQKAADSAGTDPERIAAALGVLEDCDSALRSLGPIPFELHPRIDARRRMLIERLSTEAVTAELLRQLCLWAQREPGDRQPALLSTTVTLTARLPQRNLWLLEAVVHRYAVASRGEHHLLHGPVELIALEHAGYVTAAHFDLEPTVVETAAALWCDSTGTVLGHLDAAVTAAKLLSRGP